MREAAAFAPQRVFFAELDELIRVRSHDLCAFSDWMLENVQELVRGAKSRRCSNKKRQARRASQAATSCRDTRVQPDRSLFNHDTSFGFICLCASIMTHPKSLHTGCLRHGMSSALLSFGGSLDRRRVSRQVDREEEWGAHRQEVARLVEKAAMPSTVRSDRKAIFLLWHIVARGQYAERQEPGTIFSAIISIINRKLHLKMPHPDLLCAPHLIAPGLHPSYLFRSLMYFLAIFMARGANTGARVP